MKSKEEVLNLLVDLGSTEDKVANKLVSLGIKGDRKKCNTCPIAQYLVSKGIDGRDGNENGDEIKIGIGIGSYWYSLATYPQITGIYNFIRAFDRGEYPQCEAEPK
jgi:hypothetical protein